MISLIYSNTDQRADYTCTDGNLDTDEGLETAVTISLFTDARAQEADGVSTDQDPRGWWGSAYLNPEGELGSRLWITTRNKLTNETLIRTSTSAREALQWLIDTRVALSVEATCIRMPGRTDIGLMTISIQRPRKSAPRFERVWQVQFGG